jgi:hypothetical protein
MELSLGQREINKIVDKYYDEYKGLTEPLDKSYTFVEKLRREIFFSSVVKSDEITSRNLSSRQFMAQYLDEAIENCNCESRKVSDCDITLQALNNFTFGRRDPMRGALALNLGIKPYSVIACLFSLYEGQKLSSEGWELIWFPGLEELRVSSDGGHRTLAHMLMGNLELNPERLIVVDDTNFDRTRLPNERRSLSLSANSARFV